jgi:hypothetical protein
MKVFAIGVLRWSYFLASEYGTFLVLVICMNLVIRNGPSTYVIEKTKIDRGINFLRRSKNKLAHICANIGFKLLSTTRD